MMTNLLARLRRSGSFVAGLLIGAAIVVAAFAMAASDSSVAQTLRIVAAPVILVLGLALQAAVTATPRRRLGANAARGAFPRRVAPMIDAR